MGHRWWIIFVMMGVGVGAVSPVVAISKDMQGPAKKGVASKAIKPLKIAVLDIDRVIRDATASHGIQTSVDQRRAALQRDVEGFEKSLRAKEVTLKELQNKNDPTFEEAKKVFENEVTDVQSRISGRSKILEKVFSDARATVIEKVMALVNQVAEAQGYTLVIPRSVVMYLDDGYEITDHVLERLNKDLPAVEIKLPEGV